MRSSCKSDQRVVPALEVENTPRPGMLNSVTVTIKPAAAAASQNSFDSQDFATIRVRYEQILELRVVSGGGREAGWRHR